MIPKIIHQVWIGSLSECPDQYLRWSEDLRNMHPEWTFMWHGHKRADPDIEERFWGRASMSNYLRLKAVYEHGGIYLDVDFEPIRPLDVLLEHSAFAAEQDDGRVCNAIFGAEKGHPWIKWQLENPPQGHPHDAAWGVYSMTAAPRDGVTIIPQNLVYPWLYNTPQDQRSRHPESLCAHHWAGSWVAK